MPDPIYGYGFSVETLDFDTFSKFVENHQFTIQNQNYGQAILALIKDTRKPGGMERKFTQWFGDMREILASIIRTETGIPVVFRSEPFAPSIVMDAKLPWEYTASVRNLTMHLVEKKLRPYAAELGASSVDYLELNKYK